MQKLALLIALTLLTLAACTASDPAPTSQPPTTVNFITPSVNVTLAENRFVITLWSEGDYFTDVQSMTVQAHDPNQSGHPIVWEGAAENYNDYAIPYWVVHPDFTAPGIWRLDATLTTSEGESITGSLLANVSESAPSIVVGQIAPPSETLTLADGRPLLKLSTDVDPLPELYDQTIADAVTNGKPSIIAFASPGICSNAICAPVVDSTIKALHNQFGDAFNVLHVEIYDLETSEYIPAMAEWGLSYEPWTYVVDADGVVVARFDGPISVSELTPILAGVDS